MVGNRNGREFERNGMAKRWETVELVTERSSAHAHLALSGKYTYEKWIEK